MHVHASSVNKSDAGLGVQHATRAAHLTAISVMEERTRRSFVLISSTSRNKLKLASNRSLSILLESLLLL